MRFAAALTILAAAVAPAAEPAISGPTKVARDSLVELKVTDRPKGSAIIWDVFPEEAVTYREIPKEATLVFNAPPGTYKVKARVITTDGTEAFATTLRADVKIGVPDPPPPPPPPPGPGPAPPPPTDPLVAELKALLKADPSPARASEAKQLGELYKLMASEARKPEYATAGQLNARFRSAADLMIPGKLLPLRARTAREIEAAVPDDPDAPLADPVRSALAAVFAKLASAVEEAAR